MPSRERQVPRAEWRIGRELVEVGDELRQARLRQGVTLRAIAREIGVSHVTVLRIERGVLPGPSPQLLARQAAAVGLRLRIGVYPGGQALRDSGQVALIRRFRARVGPIGGWTAEAPVLGEGDLRAFDAVMNLPAGRIGLEFFVRLTDAQAQISVGAVEEA